MEKGGLYSSKHSSSPQPMLSIGHSFMGSTEEKNNLSSQYKEGIHKSGRRLWKNS